MAFITFVWYGFANWTFGYRNAKHSRLAKRRLVQKKLLGLLSLRRRS
jgi:hypothetical protein